MKSGRDAGCENGPSVSSQLGFCPVRRWGRGGGVLPLPSSMPPARARGGNGDFKLQGTLGDAWKHLDCHNRGVDGDQGCCSMPSGAQPSSPQRAMVPRVRIPGPREPIEEDV